MALSHVPGREIILRRSSRRSNIRAVEVSSLIDPRPYFPFYVRDFWGSDAVEAMSLEAAGLYLAMLSRQWEQGSCPGCATALRRLYGGRCSAFDESLAAVLPHFENVGGRLRNARLERERVIADAFSAKQSGAAKARWERWKADRDAKAMPRHSQTTAAAMPQDRIGSDRTGQDRTGSETIPPPSASEARAKRGDVKSAWAEVVAKTTRKPASGDAAEAMRHWESEWGRTRPTAWVWAGSADAVAVAKMVKLEGGLAETSARMTRMLQSADRWVLEHASPKLLLSKWNDWGGQVVGFGGEPVGVDAARAYALKHFGGTNEA